MGAGGKVTGSFRIDMTSVNTKIAKRDAHLRNADFFDVEHNPTMTFALANGQIFRPQALSVRLRPIGSASALHTDTCRW